MMAAMRRQSESSQVRLQHNDNYAQKRDLILQRKREQHQANEHNSLQNYVLHNRDIQKSVKKQREQSIYFK